MRAESPSPRARALLRTLLLALCALLSGALGCHFDLSEYRVVANVQSLSLSPPSTTLSPAATVTLVATETFAGGTSAKAGDAAFVPLSWSSSDPSIASVDANGVVTAVKDGSATITAKDPGGSASATSAITVESKITGLSVDPPKVTLAAGDKKTLTASATLEGGGKKDVTASVTWSSSDATVAKVAAGEVTGLKVGSAKITATDAKSGQSASADITVSAAVLKSIDVTPASPKVPLGTKQLLVATGNYSDSSTKDLTATVTWSSSSPESGTVSDAGASKGEVTGVAVGTTNIKALDAASGISGTTSVSVTSATLSSIAVTPAAEIIPKATTQQFVATGTFSDGTTKDLTSSVNWASSNTTVATISTAAGTKGLASGIAGGTTIISATDPTTSISGSTTLKVANVTLSSLAITPSPASIPKSTTQAFVATGTYSDGSTKDLTTAVSWKSSVTTVATITSAGLATGVAAGTTEIRADESVSGLFAKTTLTVTGGTLKSIDVSPTTQTIPLGVTQKFLATGNYSDGSTKDLTTSVTWSSSSITVATISNVAPTQGEATPVAAGTTTIKAVDPTSLIEGTATLIVSAATLKSISVTPVGKSVPISTTQQFTATGTYSDGSTKDITKDVTWSSSVLVVATISNAAGSEGLASALAAGTTTITAKEPSSSIVGSTTLTVTAVTLSNITVTPSSPTVPKGTTQAFVATATYSDSSTKDVTTSVTWSSSSTTVATISNAAGTEGIASTLTAGTTTITAKDVASGITGTTTMTVTSATLVSIAVTPYTVTVPKGTTQAFVATATYSDSSTKDVTTSVTWTSSSTATATISNAAGSQGLATALATGTATITATDVGASISGTATLTVTAATLTSIAVTPSTASIPKSTTQQFKATGTYSDSSTKDITASVSWTSTSTATATISNASGMQGLATSIAAGTTTITATETSSGKTGTASLTVTSVTLTSISITPKNPKVPLGTVQQFTATGTYSDSSTRDITDLVTWTSSITTIATISNAAGSHGLATPIATGSADITATETLSGVSNKTNITVTAATLVSIAVTPVGATIAKGSSKQYTATGTYSDSSTKDITATVTWSSSTPATATISNAGSTKGLATGNAAGSTTIKATDSGTSVSGSTGLTVTP